MWIYCVVVASVVAVAGCGAVVVHAVVVVAAGAVVDGLLDLPLAVIVGVDVVADVASAVAVVVAACCWGRRRFCPCRRA